MERWVGGVRRECLDRLLIVGRRQLEHVLRVYAATTTDAGCALDRIGHAVLTTDEPMGFEQLQVAANRLHGYLKLLRRAGDCNATLGAGASQEITPALVTSRRIRSAHMPGLWPGLWVPEARSPCESAVTE
jgi:hypothetical protein